MMRFLLTPFRVLPAFTLICVSIGMIIGAIINAEVGLILLSFTFVIFAYFSLRREFIVDITIIKKFLHLTK
jgi:hypothetical protein